MAIATNEKGSSFQKIIGNIAGVVNRIGVFFALIMMVLTTADVVLRYLFNSPIRGVFELTEFMMLIMVGFGLAYTQLKKDNIFVEIVAERLPRRVQAALDVFAYLLGFTVFGLIAWQCILSGNKQILRHIVSGTLGIPLQYFFYLLSFSCVLLCLVYIIDIINSVTRVVKR
jgi:TRAP-type C4-dicarboxylate transport system permease small subunit